MLTPEDTLRTLTGLELIGLRRPDAVDSPEKLRAVARVWADLLGATMGPEDLSEAVRTHLRHPERGRFWPTPADLLAAAGAAAQLAPVGPEAEAVEAWERILRRLSGALPAPEGADRYSVGDLLSATQREVFAGLGGMWALRRTEEGPALGSFRRRFLDGCTFAMRPKAKLLAGTGGFRALTDGAS